MRNMSLGQQKNFTDKIRVAFICSFANPEVNSLLNPRYSLLSLFLRKIMGLSCEIQFMETSVWISNAIHEFEKCSDAIELHVISPYSHLRKGIVEFEIRGVYYHFINNEFDFLSTTIRRNLFKNKNNAYSQYSHNRSKISKVLKRILPDLVHMFGAENPSYSLAMLDIEPSIPKIVQLQTLLNDPEFELNYTMEHSLYEYRAKCELDVIKSSNYVGTVAEKYIRLLNKQLESVEFLNTILALGEDVDISIRDTKYDFVYFAKEIEKAADYAIEAFAIAHHHHPEITLDIVGGYGDAFKKQLDNRLKELGIAHHVHFEGSLPSHADVINQIRKSRFAVIPLKIDLVSGTIRESMANGIPVVTNITPATPDLNIKNICVLLSEKGDHKAMAENMCMLLENKVLADTLRQNAANYMNERAGNAQVVNNYINSYKKIICRNGISG